MKKIGFMFYLREQFPRAAFCLKDIWFDFIPTSFELFSCSIVAHPTKTGYRSAPPIIAGRTLGFAGERWQFLT
jgi:hypothetical protein